jgi:CBS domain-containing protein
MSPRAACQLDRLGFERVYDYTAGIADWKAAGLPTDGTTSPTQRIADATRPDIPTCQSDDTIAVVRSLTFEAGWDDCIVVDCDDIVVGRLRTHAWDAADTATAYEVMELGPTTVRPDGLLSPLVDRMKKRGIALVTVATPQGRLIGVLLTADGERLVSGDSPTQVWVDCDGCPGQWKPSHTNAS